MDTLYFHTSTKLIHLFTALQFVEMDSKETINSAMMETQLMEMVVLHHVLSKKLGPARSMLLIHAVLYKALS
jgi:hypothetical protein